jgi:hypothetical protein
MIQKNEPGIFSIFHNTCPLKLPHHQVGSTHSPHCKCMMIAFCSAAVDLYEDHRSQRLKGESKHESDQNHALDNCASSEAIGI